MNSSPEDPNRQRRFDTPWKDGVKELFDEFLCFFHPELDAARDPDFQPKFLDPQFPASSEAPEPIDREVDLFVELRLKDQSQRILYLHIEIQSQYERDFEARVADYYLRALAQYGQSVTILVILADDRPNWRPNSFQSDDVFDTSFKLNFKSRKLLDEPELELEASENPFALFVLAHRCAQRTGIHDPERTYALRYQFILRAREKNWPQSLSRHCWRFLQWSLRLPPEAELRLVQALRTLEPQMPYLTPIEDAAEQRGLATGLATGQRSLLELQIVARLGESIRPELEKLATLEAETLREIATLFATERDDQRFLAELRKFFSN